MDLEHREAAPGVRALDDYSLRAMDKLRYSDTDRQGHVNNAVFSQLLEDGRVELLYDLARPLAAEGCSFVIARLLLDLRSEMTWPGNVDIGTRVAAVGRSSITLEQGLFQDGRCAATATTVIVHVNNASRRSQALTSETVQLLQSLH